MHDISGHSITKISVTDQELNYLKKTSIDYIFCDETDKPLFCIEFDGLYDGFNLGKKYVSNRPASGSREWGMNVKLKVAHGSLFPYFVLNNDHMQDLPNELQVAIVDGIIGEIKAAQIVRERVAEFNIKELGETEKTFNTVEESVRDEIIQDWLTVTEIEAQMENNPVSAKVGELTEALGVYGHSVKFLKSPEKEPPKTQRQAINFWNDIIRVGATVTVQTKTYGEFKRTVWLPNFNVPGFSTGSIIVLAEEIAHLMALEAARKAIPKKNPFNS